MDRTGEARVRELVAAAEAGGFKLPPAVVEAVSALDRLAAMLAAVPPSTSPDAAEEAATVEALAAVQAGRDVGDLGEKALQARDAAEENAARARVLREVQERLRYSASQSLLNCADEITAATQGAVDGIMSEAAKLAPAIKGAESAEAVLRGGDAAVRAWRQLEALASRYAAVRQAYQVVYGAAFSSQVADATGAHLEFENVTELFPSVRRTSERPWPESPAARLAFVALSELRPWTPRPEQLNEAFEAERERVKEQQAQAHAAAQERRVAMMRG
ncbi:hypothetical protein BH20ACT24_BH20ACT24_16170 [soil metagenome]